MPKKTLTQKISDLQKDIQKLESKENLSREVKMLIEKKKRLLTVLTTAMERGKRKKFIQAQGPTMKLGDLASDTNQKGN